MTSAQQVQPVAPAEPLHPVTRHPVLAFILGVVAPGLGLIFVGRGLLGLMVSALWIGGGVGIAALVMDTDPASLARVHFATSAFIVVLSGVASALLARRPSARRGYEHWWWMFGFALVSWTVNSEVREELVSKRFGFAMRMHDESMAPGMAPGELMVVDARRAPDPGDVVVLHIERAGEPVIEVARVLGRAGQSVRIDNGRLTIDDVPVPEEPCTAADLKVPGLACAAQTLGRTRFAVGGDGCTVPVTSVPSGQLFVAPDARTLESCRVGARLVQKADVLGVAIRAR